MENKKVGLIGCGPSGMAIIAAFNEAKKNGIAIPKIVCFEKQDQVGGLWNLTWRTGFEENGEPVHGSMYQHLWSNSPKEAYELSDYTFDDHFKKPVPSYPPRTLLEEYIKERFNKCRNGQEILLNTVVRNVAQSGDQFAISYENLISKECQDDIFDYVIVATGHFSYPSLPYYPGIEKYCGRVLHSHDFRNAEEFKDQIVVIVGSGYSGEDIAIQLHKYGVKQCFVSHRSPPKQFKWPENIKEVPLIEKFEKDLIHFKDGSTTTADAVIFCTGYKHHFPFMEDKLRLKDATNIFYPNHLYKGILLEGNTNVIYLGMQNKGYTFTMFEAQAWFARDVILGQIKLPDDKVKLNEDIKKWYDMQFLVTCETDVVHFQRDYIANLIEHTGHGSQEDNTKIGEMFKEHMKNRDAGILTYRDKCFTSNYTGTVAAEPKISWIHCLDDSKEMFLNNV